MCALVSVCPPTSLLLESHHLAGLTAVCDVMTVPCAVSVDSVLSDGSVGCVVCLLLQLTERAV